MLIFLAQELLLLMFLQLQLGNIPPSSNHYASNGGRAIDIDMVNGIPVKNPKSHEKVDAFQRAIRENPILRENFGPHIQEKEGKTKRISGHNNSYSY